MKTTRLALPCYCALALLAAACDGRPPIAPDEPSAEVPAAVASADAGAASAAGAAGPSSMEVDFKPGIARDLADAFGDESYVGYRKIDTMTIYAGYGQDVAEFAQVGSVRTMSEAGGATLSLVLNGVRLATDDPAGAPGSTYHVLRALYDGMKSPERIGYGSTSRTSPGGRVSCMLTIYQWSSLTCTFTGVTDIRTSCPNCR